MGRELRSRAAAPSATTSDSTVTAAETSGAAKTATSDAPRAKLDKSGLYDLQQVKRLLDDEVIAFMEDRGYAEATLVSYVKMITGTIAVIVALYSHFNGGQFPETRDLVLGCVVVYFLCAGTINAASFVFEASAFYVGKLSARARQVNKGALALSVWVHSTIGTKGTSLYNVEFRRGARSKLDAVKFSKGYENYFTVEGRLLRDELRKDLGEALGKLGADAKKSR